MYIKCYSNIYIYATCVTTNTAYVAVSYIYIHIYIYIYIYIFISICHSTSIFGTGVTYICYSNRDAIPKKHTEKGRKATKYVVLSELYMWNVYDIVFILTDMAHFSCMMISSNWNIFSVTGPLRGRFTGQQWFPITKASYAERWWFRWTALGLTVVKTIETPVILDAISLTMT